MRFLVYLLTLLISWFFLWDLFVHATETGTWGPIRETKSSRELRKPFHLVSSFYNDESIYRFVSRTTPLTSVYYIPKNLTSLSGAYINEAGRRSLIRSDAKEALDRMAEDFFITFSEKLVVISAYRSAAYQQRLWDLGRCTDSLCAPPGHSEHQLWLAVDFFDATTESEFYTNPRYVRYIAWLKRYAHLYGWTQSYQKWESIDEYEIEPWHWRYVGIDMATRLYNLGWTYTEYVRFQESLAKRY